MSVLTAANEVTGLDARDITILLMVLAVTILQVVYSIVNNRNNNSVGEKVDKLKNDLKDALDENHKSLQKSVGEMTSTLKVLNGTIETLSEACACWTKSAEMVREIHEILDKRDDEGRRRVYIPAKSAEIQKSILNLIGNMNTAQTQSLALIQKMSGAQTQITANLKSVGQALQNVLTMVASHMGERPGSVEIPPGDSDV